MIICRIWSRQVVMRRHSCVVPDFSSVSSLLLKLRPASISVPCSYTQLPKFSNNPGITILVSHSTCAVCYECAFIYSSGIWFSGDAPEEKGGNNMQQWIKLYLSLEILSAGYTPFSSDVPAAWHSLDSIHLAFRSNSQQLNLASWASSLRRSSIFMPSPVLSNWFALILSALAKCSTLRHLVLVLLT